MRHNRKGRKLSRTNTHRRAMLRNMVTSLFEHERIETTIAKAKEARPVAERLITRARTGSLAARRLISAYVRSEDVARKLMEDIGPRFATRPGGYTRIYRLGPRPGDAGQMGILELVERKIVKPAPKKDAVKKKGKAEPADEEAEETEAKGAKAKAGAKAKSEKKPAAKAKPKTEKAKTEKADKKEAAEKRRAAGGERTRTKSAVRAKPTQAGRKSGGSSKSGREG
jgi:large subunit ribosomal protein L17